MRWFFVPLLSVLLMLGSCSLLSPEQKDQIRSELALEYQDGNITRSQYDAALEALEADGDVDWEGLGISVLNILMGGVLGFTGVRIQRGKPTQKVGLPKEMVKG